jgi:predicted phage-related endonuclease
MVRQHLPDGSLNPAWVAARRGCLGASSIADILKEGRKKGEPSQTRMSLAAKLAAERWASMAMDNLDPNNEDVARGNRVESYALAEYEVLRGCIVDPAAWIEHPRIFGAGATPDAFVNHDGLAQVKSPRPLKMTNLMRAGVIPTEYVDQLDWELAVTGRQWNDLILYNPDLPNGKHIWIRRHYRNDEKIARLESEAEKFLAEVEACFDELCKIEFLPEAA